MKKIEFSLKNILYLIVSIFVYVIVIISIDYNQSIIGIIMTLLLGLFLTQWYLFVGLLYPRDNNEVRFFRPRDDGSLLPFNYVLYGSLFISIYVIILGFISINNFGFFDTLIILFYVLGPVFLLKIKNWVGMFLTVIWVWFPIEWDLISDHFHISFGLPFPALLGLFSMLWPAIMMGRHKPWFDWNITKDDLKYVNIAIISVTIAVVPLGLVIYFLRINFDKFVGKSFIDGLGLVILTFMGIFVVQGIMEETLFRDIIMKHLYFTLKDLKKDRKVDYGILSIIAGGILITSIPFWDEFLNLLSKIPISIFKDTAIRVGSLSDPLGQHNGAMIPGLENTPLWPFYLLVAIFLTIIGIIVYTKNEKNLVIAALFTSAMIFGFAHFEDWRYVLFASYAGLGYGYTYYKTKNLLASALVHMGVDAIWSLILTY